MDDVLILCSNRDQMAGHYYGIMLVGLDGLVKHYYSDAVGLPCKLNKPCHGTPPPDYCRATGYTNLLHKAITEGQFKFNYIVKIICRNTWDRGKLIFLQKEGANMIKLSIK